MARAETLMRLGATGTKYVSFEVTEEAKITHTDAHTNAHRTTHDTCVTDVDSALKAEQCGDLATFAQPHGCYVAPTP